MNDLLRRAMYVVALVTGLNLMISNNNMEFHLTGWASFGVGVVSGALLVTGIMGLVRDIR